jgi:hypothetical protein
MSDFNRRELLRITLTPDRLHVAAQRVVFHATAVTSVEVGPDHAVYISQPTPSSDSSARRRRAFANRGAHLLHFVSTQMHRVLAVVSTG